MPMEAPTTAVAGETHTLTVQIGASAAPLKLALPAGELPPEAVLPTLNTLVDAVVRQAITAAEAKGRTMSCQSGCAACCRHLALVSDVEARALADLVERMPEPRRGQLRARFAAARRRIQDSGLSERIAAATTASAQDLRALGRDYFRQAIDCPFLEDERCSIYADRPVVCRRMIATTPAAYCADPDDDRVRLLRVPMSAAALWLLTSDDDPPRPTAMPLPFALAWAEANRSAVPRRGADVWMRRFVERLAKAQG
ncbi:MAG TPA: YkgJ family cysteine cluster protein [Vineibacter sp.]|nr:YkgJ family cysteine cluster protein [Vineibacter sp.]